MFVAFLIAAQQNEDTPTVFTSFNAWKRNTGELPVREHRQMLPVLVTPYFNTGRTLCNAFSVHSSLHPIDSQASQALWTPDGTLQLLFTLRHSYNDNPSS